MSGGNCDDHDLYDMTGTVFSTDSGETRPCRKMPSQVVREAEGMAKQRRQQEAVEAHFGGPEGCGRWEDMIEERRIRRAERI